MTVIDDFRNELMPIINVVVTTRLPRDKYFKLIEIEGKILSFPPEIYHQYYSARKILRLKANSMGKLVSDKALERKLDEFLIELKYSVDQEKIKHEIEKHIVSFFKSLKQMKLEKYLFIIPVMNLRVEENIEIGDSSIVNLDEQVFASLESKYTLKFSFKDEGHKDFVAAVPKENQTQTFAIIVTEATDSTKALELAIQKTETCLNILRLYGHDAPFVTRDEYRSSITWRLIHINLNEGTYGENGTALNMENHFPAVINKEIIDKLNKTTLPKINNLLSKDDDELTVLQGDLLKAIFWFGNASKEKHRNMQFVKGMFALEALLVPDGGTAKLDKIAKRFASITFKAEPDQKKKEAFEDMRNMYKLRSSIVHSGGYVDEEDLTKNDVLGSSYNSDSFSSVRPICQSTRRYRQRVPHR